MSDWQVEWPERLNRFVDALQRGKRPPRHLGTTSDEVEELRLAARLFGTAQADAAPDPAFLERLRTQVGAGRRPAQRRVSRGSLLRAAALWAAGVASGFAIDLGLRRIGTPAIAPATAPAAPPVLVGGNWFSAGPLDSLPVGTVKAFNAGAVPLYLVRDDQSIRAVSRICTHMGCMLRYDKDWNELDCPCHGAVFGLDGALKAYDNPTYSSIKLPPLPTAEVRVVNGTVYVLGA
jgi:nitrite reductase/ring-hydroxylating ferredoxin subunit